MVRLLILKLELMICSIKVDNIVWPSLKTIWPDFTKGQINAKLTKIVNLIASKYPEGHDDIYSIPGSKAGLVNRPVIKREGNKWTVTAWNAL